MGYKTMIHPMVANPNEVEKSICDKWYSALDCMAAEHNTNEDDQAFLDNLEKLQEAKLVVDNVLQIPISVEKEIQSKWNALGKNHSKSQSCRCSTSVGVIATQPIT